MKTQALLDRIERDWRNVRPDLDPTPMLTVISVQRTSSLLEKELEAFFATFDLTPSSYDVIATLRRSAPPEGLSFTELSALMAITPPAVTKRVDVLEKRGLVERAAHATDRRASLVRLTARGLALVDQVVSRHAANENRLLAALDDTERAQLRELLGRLAAHIERVAT